MRLSAFALILLAGCGVEHHDWKCIGGLTHERINGAWVLLDGHVYLAFKDGPIKCAAEPVT